VLRGWIDRRETAQDLLTQRLAQGFRATFDDEATMPAMGEMAPIGIHWCLAPPAVPQSGLGPDGHAARGGFLPPVPLPRRMWAGGRLDFHDTLRVGDAVERHSRIVDVVAKQGRSGPLCFVTVEHELSTTRGLAVRERHDIVYRGEGGASSSSSPIEGPAAQWSKPLRTDPVQLFRYSALTFNGHRIHYDREYATKIEHYPGLIVHGPLQATLLMRFAAEISGAMPTNLQFRGIAPLFDDTPFAVHACEGNGGLELWVASSAGVRTMTAQAR
jgi:3-methylfumaryl-CoA hydratase